MEDEVRSDFIRDAINEWLNRGIDYGEDLWLPTDIGQWEQAFDIDWWDDVD